MEHRFTYIGEETSQLEAVLDLALRSKVWSEAKMQFAGWTVEGSTMTLHTSIARAKYPFPVPLGVSEVYPMVRSWYGSGKPQAVKHDHDVNYHKAFWVEGLPFDEHITITITETEYHK